MTSPSPARSGPAACAPDPSGHGAVLVRSRLLGHPRPGTVTIARGLPLGGRSTWLRQQGAVVGPGRALGDDPAGRAVVHGGPAAARRLADLSGFDTDGALVALDDADDADDELREALLALVDDGAALVATTGGEVDWLPRRWHLTGRVRLIGPEDLALTAPELSAALALRGVALPADHVTEVWRRVDGWPGIVEVLGPHAGKDAAELDVEAVVLGAGRALASEALERLDPGHADVVVRVADREHLVAGLADRLSEGAAAVMGGLASTTSWVRRDRDGWQVHPLIRLGLARLAEEDPAIDVAALRRTAARWALEQGDAAAAADLMVEAREWTEAVRIVAGSVQTASHLVIGDQLPDLLDRIPEHHWWDEPTLLFGHALSRMLRGEPTEGLAEVESYLRRATLSGSDPGARNRADVFVASSLWWSTTPEDVLAAAERAASGLARVRDVPGVRDQIEDFRQYTEVLAATAEIMLDRHDHATTRLVRLVDDGQRTNPIRTMVHGTLALVHAASGDLARAEGQARLAAVSTSPTSPLARVVMAAPDIALGLVGALQGDAPAVSAATDPLVARGRTSRAATLHAWALAPLASSLLQRGDLTGLETRLDEVPDGLHASVATPLVALRARLLVRRGRGADARRLLRGVHVSTETVLAHAEVARATEDASRREQVLAWRPPSRDPWPHLASALAQLVVQADGDRAGSRAARSRAAGLARETGIVGPLLELAPPLTRQVVSVGGHDLADLVTRARRRTGENRTLRTALTVREDEVLRLLDHEVTLVELAEMMDVSPNTVKTHVRSLYRKLGVSSRGDAVASAREQGWI